MMVCRDAPSDDRLLVSGRLSMVYCNRASYRRRTADFRYTQNFSKRRANARGRILAAAPPNVARLWTTVLLANLVGALLFAFVIARTTAFDPDVEDAFVRIGQEGLRAGFATTLLRGVFAGWLIALMVWLLPFAESARVWVII